MGTPALARGPLVGWALPAAPVVARAADAAILPVTAGLLWYATVAQGAFYRAQASLFSAGLVAVALAATGSASGLAPAIGGFALLGAGVTASGAAAGWGPNAALAIASLFAGLAIVPVVWRVIARGERARLLDAIAWIGAATAAVGIAGVAWHRAPFSIRAQGLWRASSTLTYANAAACLFVLALGASVLVLAERSTAARRVAAFGTLVGLAATLSRGGAVSAIVALVVLVLLRRTDVLRPLVRPVVGALIAFAALLPSIAGGRPRPALAILGVCAGALVAARAGEPATARRRRATLAGLGVVLVATASVVGSGRVIEKRAVPVSETRLSTWRNTWTVALRNPAFGTGPGTFWILEESRDGDVGITRYAHNEYLQVFFETGAVGLATVVGALGIFTMWAWRRRRDDGGHWAVACAMCAAFAAHSAVDFVWRMPLLVAIAFAWLAVAVTAPPENGGNDERVVA